MEATIRTSKIEGAAKNASRTRRGERHVNDAQNQTRRDHGRLFGGPASASQLPRSSFAIGQGDPNAPQEQKRGWRSTCGSLRHDFPLIMNRG